MIKEQTFIIIFHIWFAALVCVGDVSILRAILYAFVMAATDIVGKIIAQRMFHND